MKHRLSSKLRGLQDCSHETTYRFSWRRNGGEGPSKANQSRACGQLSRGRRVLPGNHKPMNERQGNDLNANGKPSDNAIPDGMPFVWTLRDVLSMTGTTFGCGTGACGACTIHIDGQPVRSCITPVSTAVGRRIITIQVIRPRQGLATAYLSSPIPCTIAATRVPAQDSNPMLD